MALNAAVIMPPLQQVIFDKTLDTFLADGQVYFYEDSNRTVPKNVYFLEGTGPGSYTYVSAGAVLTLSGIGSFVDFSGSNVAIYLWPFTGTPNDNPPSQTIQNYYIEVYSSTGVFQFDIPNWPGATSNASPTNNSDTTDNIISNGQFVDVNFTTDATMSSPWNISVTGTLTATEIAPDWSVITTGSGTISVYQQPINDINAPGNPAYALGISSSGFNQPIILRQRLLTPRIFANDYVSGTFIVESTNGGIYDVSMNYIPSLTGVIQTICSGNTLSSGFVRIFNSNPTLISSSISGTGYVDITLVFPVNAPLQISCIQLCGVADSTEIVNYLEETPEREVDHLFHYFQPQINFKPSPSYLVGWDFPLNPSQWGNPGLQAIGANTSFYGWDQTIIFQTVTNSVLVGRYATGELFLTAGTSTQMAIIQYLTGPQMQSLLVQAATGVSVNIAMSSGVTQNLSVSLWWTTGSIPSLGSNASLVTGLAANGRPSVVAGWNEIKIPLNPGLFTTNNTQFVQNYEFSGFIDLDAYKTATAFAIVIGSSTVTALNYLLFQSVSIVPGLIPTIPGPQTVDEVLRECQYYYQKSFAVNTVPAQNVGVGLNESYGLQTIAGLNSNWGPIIRFATPMRTIPNITLYNPAAANAQIRNEDIGADYTGTDKSNITTSGFLTFGTSQVGFKVGDLQGINWTADARLGIV